MANTSFIHGQKAESAAADYLVRQGYTIVARNWRTKWCEIDIIASRGATIYFVEVKYRQFSRYGSGYDAVTSAKRRQMSFAAELWLARHDGTKDCQLAVCAVSGLDYQTIELIDLDY